MKSKLFGFGIANKIKVMFNRNILAKGVCHVDIFCQIGLLAFKVISIHISISVPEADPGLLQHPRCGCDSSPRCASE